MCTDPVLDLSIRLSLKHYLKQTNHTANRLILKKQASGCEKCNKFQSFMVLNILNYAFGTE
jgi:hypothetical protein